MIPDNLEVAKALISADGGSGKAIKVLAAEVRRLQSENSTLSTILEECKTKIADHEKRAKEQDERIKGLQDAIAHNLDREREFILRREKAEPEVSELLEQVKLRHQG